MPPMVLLCQTHRPRIGRRANPQGDLCNRHLHHARCWWTDCGGLAELGHAGNDGADSESGPGAHLHRRFGDSLSLALEVDVEFRHTIPWSTTPPSLPTPASPAPAPRALPKRNPRNRTPGSPCTPATRPCRPESAASPARPPAVPPS